ncbi:MAG TPA: hypothetical protein VF173_31965 [Thermoanaerobaculia bacterium]|nr:hypothetical protein [Thermoanaerobaculia bacterium]
MLPRPPASRGRRRLLLLPVLACACLASCFDSPIQESLRLRFFPDGSVMVTSSVTIEPLSGSANPALEKRLAAARRDFLEGTDPWGPRFAALAPAAERFSWEKWGGELKTLSRSALVDKPEGLAPFFGDSSLRVLYEVRKEEGTAELSIAPGLSARATRRQRQQMQDLLARWTGEVAAYLEATRKLYAYTEEHPDRARVCFGSLFKELLAEKDRKGLGEPTDDEKKLLEDLGNAMEKVWDVRLVPTGEDHSPDEISHLVYDPFPARLTVALPGPPLAVEGFEKGPDGKLVVAGLSLWDALRSLQGRWVSPDPVLIYVERRGESDHPLDLEAFLRQPRRAEEAKLLPSAEDVRRELEARLTPAPLYRVTWKVSLGEDDGEFHWEEP